MRPLRFIVFLIGIVFGPSIPALAGSPSVVVSIAPLHSLVAGVMEGAGEPVLLVPAGASPHAFALRPSDAVALQKARLVVLAGAGLERFLDRPLAALSGRAEIVKLAALPGVRLRELGGHHAHDGHDADHHDPHIWLDPENAIAIVAALRDILGALDPENAALYRRNAGAMVAALGLLDREIAAQLAPVQARPFITFHDAYGYFAERYRLDPVGTLVLSPDIPPGAARVAEIVRLVRDRKAVCVFSEPQFEPRLVTRLAEDSDVRVGIADPLGSGLPTGPGHYAATLRALAGSFRDCLAGAGSS